MKFMQVQNLLCLSLLMCCGKTLLLVHKQIWTDKTTDKQEIFYLLQIVTHNLFKAMDKPWSCVVILFISVFILF